MKELLRKALLVPLALAWAYGRFLESFRPELYLQWADNVTRANAFRTMEIVDGGALGGAPLTIHTPNAVCRFRARTYLDKEPETLAWIDEFGGGGAFFDVGANVGLYSIYYARRHVGRVFAFEPSVFNLGQLARNLQSNGVSDQVTIIPIPLTEANQIASFHLTSTEEGGALSSFGELVGPDGRKLVEVMHYDTVGVSLDFMLGSGMLPDLPTIMKIDVDGLEHFILRGATSLLSDATLRSVLIEVDDSFRVLADDVTRLLGDAGFRFREKRHAEMFDDGNYATSFNQIWVKD